MCVHVGAETLVMRTTMKKLEKDLGEINFARIHRSTLVNVSRIRKIETLGKGDCILHLPDGITLKASRSYREQLMALLG
jgi:two-component system LytT family response regulator